MTNNQPIGMFDSGVGGLTVLKAAEQLLPNEQFIYIGDTARMPYGPRTVQEIIDFSIEIARYLVKHYHIKLLVIACNTATAAAMPTLQEQLEIPVLGVINSGAQAAVSASQHQKIGLIATQGTVDSNRYQSALKTLDPSATVIAQAEPDFVRWVEEGRFSDDSLQAAVDEHLAAFTKGRVDTLILACTHFPLMANMIQKAVGPEVHLIDAGQATAQMLAHYVDQHQLARDSASHLPNQLMTTGTLKPFQEIVNRWLSDANQRTITQLPVNQLKE